MPTIPTGQSPRSQHEPHRIREVAESFGVDPERYDRSRPRYPDAMVAAIVAASPGRDFLDVGIGTGIVARQFQAAGCTVLGVEPDDRMAEFARRNGTEVEVATFEAWDPRGRTFDTVVSGQAWHWVDPVAGATKAAEVLRPGGQLAVFWNVNQPPPELAEAFAEVYRQVLPDSPIARMAATPVREVYTTMGDTASEGIRRTSAFGEPELRRFDWRQSYTRDEWLELSATTGLTTRLPQEVLNEVLVGLGAAIDAVGGSFTTQYTAAVVTAVRSADE
ncbi:class I SAM-dependent methyltransferase [Nocardia iowensis]|uniref:Methyltransferase domain-containing protein n=1 Tax=Nocardia iowensis TaxID=204891 RepID=A0ABX8RUL6_NOCIO|nr:class I SAM-dependent methyltransferase [Nocardia iowensis]QXN93322.1 methyltransferase domain-containing protein [Nocardia iowensis]